MKIVVVIEGGVLQNVYADSEPVEVVLVDFDNLKFDNLKREGKDADKILEKAIDGLSSVY